MSRTGGLRSRKEGEWGGREAWMLYVGLIAAFHSWKHSGVRETQKRAQEMSKTTRGTALARLNGEYGPAAKSSLEKGIAQRREESL